MSTDPPPTRLGGFSKLPAGAIRSFEIALHRAFRFASRQSGAHWAQTMKIKDGASRSATENVSVDDRSPPKIVAGDDRRTGSGKCSSFARFIAGVKSRVVDVYR